MEAPHHVCAHHPSEDDRKCQMAFPDDLADQEDVYGEVVLETFVV